MTQKKSSSPARDVVTLADLAPQHDVKGGSQRRVFGADPIAPSSSAKRSDMNSTKTPARKVKDLPPRSTGVKGGGHNLNENISLIRAAKPGKKAKDLAPKSPNRVKGGGVNLNDNITLIGAAR